MAQRNATQRGRAQRAELQQRQLMQQQQQPQRLDFVQEMAHQLQNPQHYPQRRSAPLVDEVRDTLVCPVEFANKNEDLNKYYKNEADMKRVIGNRAVLITEEEFRQHRRNLARCNVERLSVHYAEVKRGSSEPRRPLGVFVCYKTSLEPEGNLRHLNAYHHFMRHPTAPLPAMEGNPSDGKNPNSVCRLCRAFQLSKPQPRKTPESINDTVDFTVERLSEARFRNVVVNRNEPHNQTTQGARTRRLLIELYMRVHWSPDYVTEVNFEKYERSLQPRLKALMEAAKVTYDREIAEWQVSYVRFRELAAASQIVVLTQTEEEAEAEAEARAEAEVQQNQEEQEAVEYVEGEEEVEEEVVEAPRTARNGRSSGSKRAKRQSSASTAANQASSSRSILPANYSIYNSEPEDEQEEEEEEVTERNSTKHRRGGKQIHLMEREEDEEEEEEENDEEMNEEEDEEQANDEEEDDEEMANEEDEEMDEEMDDEDEEDEEEDDAEFQPSAAAVANKSKLHSGKRSASAAFDDDDDEEEDEEEEDEEDNYEDEEFEDEEDDQEEEEESSFNNDWISGWTREEIAAAEKVEKGLSKKKKAVSQMSTSTSAGTSSSLSFAGIFANQATSTSQQARIAQYDFTNEDEESDDHAVASGLILKSKVKSGKAPAAKKASKSPKKSSSSKSSKKAKYSK